MLSGVIFLHETEMYLYRNLFHSHLSYRLTVWGHATSCKSPETSKECSRIMTCGHLDHYASHCFAGWEY